jgi:ABC-type sugar transport system ATPase subunit
MARVTIQNVEKRFGSLVALADINLVIEDREFVALVGPSGSGKSTLLRIAAGLEKATGGDVQIDGRSMKGVAPKDRDVAMVFQSHALYPHMSVYNNLAFNLRVRGVPRAAIEAKIREVAERLHITELLDRRPRQMSGGQRQRVAIGRALVRDPKVFLFDEPLSSLDAELRVRLRTEIKRLHQELHRTSIYVTHDQVEAMTLADRIVVLRQGRIEQIGSPEELYQRPVNLFVAGFIGSPAINLVEGNAQDGRLSIGKGIALDVAVQHRGPCVVGIRPEDLLTVDASASGALATRVTLVQPMGADTLVFGALPDGTELSVRLPCYVPVSVGQPLTLRPRAGGTHVFDPASEKRVG